MDKKLDSIYPHKKWAKKYKKVSKKSSKKALKYLQDLCNDINEYYTIFKEENMDKFQTILNGLSQDLCVIHNRILSINQSYLKGKRKIFFAIVVVDYAHKKCIFERFDFCVKSKEFPPFETPERLIKWTKIFLNQTAIYRYEKEDKLDFELMEDYFYRPVGGFMENEYLVNSESIHPDGTVRVDIEFDDENEKIAETEEIIDEKAIYKAYEGYLVEKEDLGHLGCSGCGFGDIVGFCSICTREMSPQEKEEMCRKHEEKVKKENLRRAQVIRDFMICPIVRDFTCTFYDEEENEHIVKFEYDKLRIKLPNEGLFYVWNG